MDEEKNDGLKSLSQNFKKRVWIVLVTFVLLALMVFVGFRALHLDFNLVNTSIMVGVFCVVYALLMVFVKEVDSALLGLVMLLFCGHFVRWFVVVCIFGVFCGVSCVINTHEGIVSSLFDLLFSRMAVILYYLLTFLVSALLSVDWNVTDPKLRQDSSDNSQKKSEP